MTYAQDLDTGEVVQLPRPQAVEWVHGRLAQGHKPYLSETPIPASNGAAYRRELAAAVDDWSV